MDEDDYGKFRIERVNQIQVLTVRFNEVAVPGVEWLVHVGPILYPLQVDVFIIKLVLHVVSF